MEYTSELGHYIILNQISNIEVFEYIAESGLKVPKPPTYETDDGRIEENPFHPIYNDALAVYDLQRHQLALDAIVALCLSIKNIEYIEYKPQFEVLKKSGILDKRETIEQWVIKNYILTDKDMYYIVQNTLLTESRVSGIFNSIRVTRDGINIHEAHVKNAISTNIDTDSIVVYGHQLVNPIDEIKACQFSMMQWLDWLDGKISLKAKATAIALYRLDRIIDTHNNDAVQIYQERESRKNSRKG